MRKLPLFAFFNVFLEQLNKNNLIDQYLDTVVKQKLDFKYG